MFDDLIEAASGGWGVSLAVLIGAGLLLGRGSRPLLKRATQGYLTVADAARGWTATVIEQAQDLYEESKAELAATSSEAVAEGRRANPACAEA